MTTNFCSEITHSIRTGTANALKACEIASSNLCHQIGKLDRFVVSKIHSCCCGPKVSAIAIHILRSLPWLIALQLGGIYFALPLTIVWIVWGKNVMTNERQINLNNAIGIHCSIEAAKLAAACVESYQHLYLGLALVNLAISGISFSIAYFTEKECQKSCHENGPVNLSAT